VGVVLSGGNIDPGLLAQILAGHAEPGTRRAPIVGGIRG